MRAGEFGSRGAFLRSAGYRLSVLSVFLKRRSDRDRLFFGDFLLGQGRYAQSLRYCDIRTSLYSTQKVTCPGSTTQK
jgi:hypothetical protein